MIRAAAATKAYSPDRRATVQKNLTGLLENLRKTKPFLDNVEVSENNDVCAFFVEGKLEEIKRLKGQVDEYHNEGRHFTKEYRTLEGHCGKLLMELDSVVVFGRDDLKASTDTGLQEIDGMLKALHKKAHSSGKLCAKCEIKDKV